VDDEAARTAIRRVRRVLVAGLRTVVAALAKALGYRLVPLRRRGVPGEADGAVPAGVTVFDEEVPGVVNLDPALLGALRKAATDAAADQVEFYVNSGWRSPGYQQRLRREAVAKYGSEDEAARWVATAETSPHVAGNAVDIGHADAKKWLAEHGAGYGLCQIYRNEPWHYELRPDAIVHGCPPMYADPSADPRLRQQPPPAAE
jgi:D-alanyl-D-alanine carboxypeptidase